MLGGGFVRMRLVKNAWGGLALYGYNDDNSGVCVNFNAELGQIELVHVNTNSEWTIVKKWTADS